MIFDFRHNEMFFIDSKGNKREKVIELKIIRNIDDKNTNSVEVQFQNDIIIDRGSFYDEEIGVASIKNYGVAYKKGIVKEIKRELKFFKNNINTNNKIFFLIGYYTDDDIEENGIDNYLKVNDKELEEIIEKVKQINEKYGIYCRVQKDEVYYYLNDIGDIVKTTDKYSEEDNKRSEIGNYFASKRRIELFKKNLKKFIEDKIRGNFNIFYYDECLINSNYD